MAKGKPHPPEVKAAVLADLATGESLSRVARKHEVSRTTVAMWRDSAQMDPSTAVVREKRADLGEQLYGYLEDSLAALRAQLAVFADPRWLQRQPAGDLAILHGVIADKTARLLAAVRLDGPADEPGAIEADVEAGEGA